MSSELSNCSAQFQWDLNGTGPDAASGNKNDHSLKADAEAFNADEVALAQAKADVVTECKSLEGKYKGNPAALLIVLIVEVLGSRSNRAYELELKVNADGVQVQGDITKLSNDLQNIPNAGGTNDPTTGTNCIIEVAAGTDEMQNILGTNGTAGSVGTAISKDVQEALGSSASSLMCGNFANMRQDIYWGADPEGSKYNPTQVTAPAGGFTDPTKYTYHFDPDSSDSGYIHSYAEMQADLKLQGNPKGAQDANKILLDNYNQNVSTTQSLGSAANAEIGLITSRIKMNTSAVSDFSQDILTGNRTAVKNQMPQ